VNNKKGSNYMTTLIRIRSCLTGGLMMLALVSYPMASYATEKEESEGDTKDIPKAQVFNTSHQLKIGGNTIKYTATAGTMLMKNDKDEPSALFGYTAYVKSDGNQGNRPILFAYNGGPGSASIWLHMGILGPQRTVVTDADFSPNGPFKRVENKLSILDKADLVMIDPVGTGYSRPVGKSTGEDFWGVDQDIKSVSEFIVQYTTEYGRWQSPKYILGESYGGIRSGGVAYELLNKHNMALNGVILVSPFMDYAAGAMGLNIDLPYVLGFSTYAATAWYHNTIENKPANLAEFVASAEAFALNDYASALAKGNRLAADERQKVLQGMEKYTGIKAEYWDRANMRMHEGQFSKELLRDRGQNSGRIDSRFTGESINLIGENLSYDPFFPSVGPAFVATFNDYYRNELKVNMEQKYIVSGGLWNKWDDRHQLPNGQKSPWANTGVDLSYAMRQNPNMKVLVQQGYYDLATPYGATMYFIDHMDISEKLQKNISLKLYEAGHMMYVHEESMMRFKQDLAAFIE
jgi:carboxypeptidase C (cathepsin A)